MNAVSYLCTITALCHIYIAAKFLRCLKQFLVCKKSYSLVITSSDLWFRSVQVPDPHDAHVFGGHVSLDGSRGHPESASVWDLRHIFLRSGEWQHPYGWLNPSNMYLTFCGTEGSLACAEDDYSRAVSCPTQFFIYQRFVNLNAAVYPQLLSLLWLSSTSSQVKIHQAH